MNAEITISNAVSLRQTETRFLGFAVGFFFSFRQCIVLLSVQFFGVEPSIGTAVSIALDLLLLCAVCFDSLGAAQRTFGSIAKLAAVRWVFAFLALSCLSLLWSETASLTNSIVYWLGLVIDVANVILLLRRDAGIEDMHALMRGFIWSSCLLAAIAWMMPTAPDLRLGDEQYFNTNEIGNLCAFAIFFAQYLTRSKCGSWRFAKVFLVLTLVRSLSKTTLAGFLVAEACLMILDRSMSRKTKTLLLSCALMLILVFWGLFEAYYDVYTNAGNQAETLTGRTAIWLYVFNAVFDHPWNLWIGHGFDSWWKVVPPFGFEMFEARHAEDEFLQQFYAYGVTGVVLLAGIYGSLYRQLRKLRSSPTKIFLLCLLIFILVRGLAEADAFDLLLPLWSIILISALADYERSREAQLLAGQIARQQSVRL